jgi:hypothetical protein
MAPPGLVTLDKFLDGCKKFQLFVSIFRSTMLAPLLVTTTLAASLQTIVTALNKLSMS